MMEWLEWCNKCNEWIDTRFFKMRGWNIFLHNWMIMKFWQLLYELWYHSVEKIKLTNQHSHIIRECVNKCFLFRNNRDYAYFLKADILSFANIIKDMNCHIWKRLIHFASYYKQHNCWSKNSVHDLKNESMISKHIFRKYNLCLLQEKYYFENRSNIRRAMAFWKFHESNTF